MRAKMLPLMAIAVIGCAMMSIRFVAIDAISLLDKMLRYELLPALCYVVTLIDARIAEKMLAAIAIRAGTASTAIIVIVNSEKANVGTGHHRRHARYTRHIATATDCQWRPTRHSSRHNGRYR